MKKLLFTRVFSAMTLRDIMRSGTLSKRGSKSLGLKLVTAVVAVLLFSTQFTSAQKADTAKISRSQMSYSFYMHKHLTKRTTGWILFGTGSAVMVASLAILYSDHNWLADDNANTLGPIFVVGGAAALASIPFFIAAHGYHKKALLVINKESTAVGDLNINNFNYAAIGLQIQL